MLDSAGGETIVTEPGALFAAMWLLAQTGWGGGPLLGKAAFIGVFLLLLLWLTLMPRCLLSEADRRVVWWRNPRLWAIAVTLTQIAIYVCWG